MAYKVLVGLNYPTSAAVLERLAALRDSPEAERQAGVADVRAKGGFKRAEVGEIVTNLPAVSVPWLLAQGIIELVPDEEPIAKPIKPRLGSRVVEKEE